MDALPVYEKVQARNAILGQQRGTLHTKLSRHAFLSQCGDRNPPTPTIHPHRDAYALIIVDNPTPPCVLSLDQLEPMLVSELSMDFHHRGKFLLVKLVGINKVACSYTLGGIEDCTGDVEFLKLSYICMNQDIGHTWPKCGHWFVIKEPHLTINEVTQTPCIQIIHSSDFRLARRLPSTLLSRPIFAEVLASKHGITPLECKEAGNSALKDGNTHEAHDFYSEGLQTFDEQPDLLDEDVRKDLLRNRAFVRLSSGRYEGAITDAVAALRSKDDSKSKELDAKAYLRACKASYALKRYKQASDFCQQLLRLNADQQAVKLLAHIVNRLKEENYGGYNVDLIKSNLSPNSQRVDAADFLANTVIKPSRPGRGRGVFATKDLKTGDLVLVETPFSSSFGYEKTEFKIARWDARFPNVVHMGLAGPWKAVTHKVRENPVAGKQLLDLQGDHQMIGKAVFEVDGVPVVDAYQVHDIIYRNSFSTGSSFGKVDSRLALYLRSSYINHSCVANAQHVFIGDLILIHAKKPIAKGEEIFIGYSAPSADFPSRQEKLQRSFNFQCDCVLCVAEAKVPIELSVKRLHLTQDANDFIERYPPSSLTMERIIHRAEEIAANIAATYDATLYSDLPRISLIPIHAWVVEVAKAHLSCGPDNKMPLHLNRQKTSLENFLRTLGYKLEAGYEHDSTQSAQQVEFIVPTANSILTEEALALAAPVLARSRLYRTKGLKKAADHWRAFAEALPRTFCC